jgi:beta-lactamase regulating signal transducer with metallopeptidase domain
MVYHLVLRRDTFFTTNRHYLVLGVLVSALAPLIVFTRTTVIEVHANWTSTSPTPIETIVTSVNDPAQGNEWWMIALIVYGIGVLVMAIRFLGQVYSLIRLLITLPSKRHLGYVHLVTDRKVTPFSFFKFIVYNPDLHQPGELDMIIKHEQAHASQMHSLDILLVNILLIFQWMNPFAWLYKKGIEENLEFIADSEASQLVKSMKEYQLTLLKVVSTRIQPSLTNNFYQSLIKKRIVMLHKNASKTYHQWKAAVILPLLAIFLWSFNVKEVIDYKMASFEIPTVNSEVSPKEEINPFDTFVKKYDNRSNVIITENKQKVETMSNEITMGIDKNTTDRELEKISKIFKENYNVTITFSDIKRNSDDEITSIKVDVKAKKSNANFHEINENGIKPFHINYNDETGSIRVGKSIEHELHLKGNGEHVYIMEIDEDDDKHIRKWVSSEGKKIGTKDENVFIHKKGEGGNYKIVKKIAPGGENEEIIIKDIKGNHVWMDEDGDGNVFFYDDEGDGKRIWISKDGEKTVHSNHEMIVIDGDDSSGYFFMDDKDKDSLIYIDGKKSSYKDLKNLGKDKIDTIEIIKGEKAVKEYGKKAKDGVIKVSTKK